jgi:hypothetical protein
MTTRDDGDLICRLRNPKLGNAAELAILLDDLCQEAATALEAKDAVLNEQAQASYDWMKRAIAAESRITDLERQLAEETERCARAVPTNWLHPIFEKLGPTPYDCPTVETLLRSIAAAIRGGAK